MLGHGSLLLGPLCSTLKRRARVQTPQARRGDAAPRRRPRSRPASVRRRPASLATAASRAATTDRFRPRRAALPPRPTEGGPAMGRHRSQLRSDPPSPPQAPPSRRARTHAAARPPAACAEPRADRAPHPGGRPRHQRAGHGAGRRAPGRRRHGRGHHDPRHRTRDLARAACSRARSRWRTPKSPAPSTAR